MKGRGLIHVEGEVDKALCRAAAIPLDGITSIRSKHRATCLECIEVANHIMAPIGRKALAHGNFMTWEKAPPRVSYDGASYGIFSAKVDR